MKMLDIEVFEGGFKETELGPLPEEWEVVRVGEVVEITMGQSPPGETYNTQGIGMPFLQGKAEFGKVYPSPVKYTTKPLKIGKAGSVLISVRAPVGDVNIANMDYCIGRGLASISFKNGYGYNEYLFYCLQFLKPLLEKEGYGSTFKAINKEVLTKFQIPLPPLEEQQAIAGILSTVQSAIEKTEKVINALKNLKKSMMKHLFTY
ncbi:MAG: restriction endonuclease subunit S, partial [Thermocrinis sp.]|nr:restriction endonuclease subunit S [Thermocrinis sp.]